MLNFGNKEFRNLQEQVLANANDIETIKQGLGTALPDPIPGPEGPIGLTGSAGERGPRGSVWTVGTDFPASPNDKDMHLTPDAKVYQYMGDKWVYYGSIKGVPGIQGARGEKGDKGERGEQGEQGIQGTPSPISYIAGVVTSESELPDPSTVPHDYAYLLKTFLGYDLYVIIGTDTLEWLNVGSLTGNVVTKDELANYLPITGGTVEGNISVNNLTVRNKVKSNLTPDFKEGTTTYTLGTTSKPWEKLYVKDIFTLGNFDNNAPYPIKMIDLDENSESPYIRIGSSDESVGLSILSQGKTIIESRPEKQNSLVMRDLEGHRVMVVASDNPNCGIKIANNVVIAANGQLDLCPYGKSANEGVDNFFPSETDRIKMGGAEIVSNGNKDTEEVVFAYKPSGSTNEVVPFAITREGKVYYEGSEIAGKNYVETLQKQIANLKASAEGNTFNYETDSSVAYKKVVPANASPYASLDKVGGMSYKSKNILDFSKLKFDSSIASIDYNNKTITVPAKVWSVFSTSTLKEICPSLNVGDTLYVNAIYSNLNVNKAIRIINSHYYFNNPITITEDILNSSIAFLNDGSSYENIVSEIMFSKEPITKYEDYFEGIRNTKVTDVKSVGTNFVENFAIPSAIQELDGYGLGINETYYNYIDFNRLVFVENVAEIDLGTLTWAYSSGGWFYAYVKNKATNQIGLCAKYTNFGKSNVSAMPDKNFCGNATLNNDGRVSIFIKDSQYGSNATAFRNSLKGVKFVHALREPIETDISEYLTSDNFIEVQSNGTITFENEHEQAVGSEITYEVKL